MDINPIDEYDQLYNWLISLAPKQLTNKTFTNQLSRFLNRKGHPVKVKHYSGCEILDPSDWAFGAEYDVELDEQGKKPFKIDYFSCLDNKKQWKMTENKAKLMALDLVETLVHEYTHLKQFRSRKFKECKFKPQLQGKSDKKRDEQVYLSNPDEIEAYAVNISVRYYIETKRLSIIKPRVNKDFKCYQKAFGKTHPIVKDLEQQVNRNIRHLEETGDGAVKRRRFRLGRSRIRSRR